ncbi:hypothetical protein [Mycolicibacterium frederiksbergense]|uniref:hypothetical protein n=1 Tax=Mycolicibacterium frederiksbergense TaxID=117567 RepID=UPI002476FCBF|nr:hypothetical protein [Mycolicibacterium frederiksbergense]
MTPKVPNLVFVPPVRRRPHVGAVYPQFATSDQEADLLSEHLASMLAWLPEEASASDIADFLLRTGEGTLVLNIPCPNDA